MIIDDEDVMNGKWFMCQGQKKGKSLVVTVEGFEVKKKNTRWSTCSGLW